MSRQVMPCRQSKPNNSNDKKNRKRPCQRARHCYRCEWSCAVLRMALNPRFNNTGNGIYEKTPRCPGGWPVRCRCFCTGTRNGSRPRSCSRRCPRSCSTRSCSEDQGHPHGQEEDRQEGRQEENRPQGSLIWAFRVLSGPDHHLGIARICGRFAWWAARRACCTPSVLPACPPCRGIFAARAPPSSGRRARCSGLLRPVQRHCPQTPAPYCCRPVLLNRKPRP